MPGWRRCSGRIGGGRRRRGPETLDPDPAIALLLPATGRPIHILLGALPVTRGPGVLTILPVVATLHPDVALALPGLLVPGGRGCPGRIGGGRRRGGPETLDPDPAIALLLPVPRGPIHILLGALPVAGGPGVLTIIPVVATLHPDVASALLGGLVVTGRRWRGVGMSRGGDPLAGNPHIVAAAPLPVAGLPDLRLLGALPVAGGPGVLAILPAVVALDPDIAPALLGGDIVARWRRRDAGRARRRRGDPHARDEDETIALPLPASCLPHHVLLGALPVTGGPGVLAVLPVVAAQHPDVAGAWRWRLIAGCGRRGDRVSRHWWRRRCGDPGARDPDEAVALTLPAPGVPLHVLLGALPVTGGPDVLAVAPVVVALHPDVASARRRGLIARRRRFGRRVLRHRWRRNGGATGGYPATVDPVPAVVTPLPATILPGKIGPGALPITRLPLPLRVVPLPVPPYPDIARTWRLVLIPGLGRLLIDHVDRGNPSLAGDDARWGQHCYATSKAQRGHYLAPVRFHLQPLLILNPTNAIDTSRRLDDEAPRFFARRPTLALDQ